MLSYLLINTWAKTLTKIRNFFKNYIYTSLSCNKYIFFKKLKESSENGWIINTFIPTKLILQKKI